jgi:hypothetical protein
VDDPKVFRECASEWTGRGHCADRIVPSLRRLLRIYQDIVIVRRPHCRGIACTGRRLVTSNVNHHISNYTLDRRERIAHGGNDCRRGLDVADEQRYINLNIIVVVVVVVVF